MDLGSRTSQVQGGRGDLKALAVGRQVRFAGLGNREVIYLQVLAAGRSWQQDNAGAGGQG